MPRRSAAEAARTREAIVARAVDVASVEGLEGLTIGSLAGDLELSKAGVLGHFGSKEALQLAALEAAIASFRAEVWERAAKAEPGLRRLEAICEAWVSYLARDVFPGGCFLTAAACEFDGRPGRVREAVARALGTWRDILAAEARAAIEAGDLAPGADPDEIAFEIGAIAAGANQAIQLLGDRRAPGRARAAMARVLAADR